MITKNTATPIYLDICRISLKRTNLMQECYIIFPQTYVMRTLFNVGNLLSLHSARKLRLSHCVFSCFAIVWI